MPYDHKLKKLVTYLGEDVGRRSELTINHYVRKSILKPTESEKRFKRIAHLICYKYHVRYSTQKPFHIAAGITFIVDIYFTKFKLAAEIDGRHHHSQDAKEKDEWRTRVLHDACGVEVVRFDNQQVVDDPLGVTSTLVEKLLLAPHATPSHKNHLAMLHAQYPLDEPQFLEWLDRTGFFK